MKYRRNVFSFRFPQLFFFSFVNILHVPHTQFTFERLHTLHRFNANENNIAFAGVVGSIQLNRFSVWNILLGLYTLYTSAWIHVFSSLVRRIQESWLYGMMALCVEYFFSTFNCFIICCRLVSIVDSYYIRMNPTCFFLILPNNGNESSPVDVVQMNSDWGSISIIYIHTLPLSSP